MSKKVKKMKPAMTKEKFLIEGKNVEVEMNHVESSQIESIGWVLGKGNKGTKIPLVVKFLRGGVYYYRKVEQTKIADLMVAESIGSFLNSEIKGKYEYIKLV